MDTAHQLLRDADIEPTADIIADGLGATNAVYLKFIGDLQEYGISLMDWRFYFKRLEKERFRWPEIGEDATMTMTGEELSILLGGAKIELKLRRREVTARRAI